jgi:signal transduction histidine kinase/HAMP domain-containing protein/ActR/RegA family two-component response regulator
MISFTSLRVRLVGTVFLAIAPAWILMYFTNLPWIGFAVGLLALIAAWYGGEVFILRQVQVLARSAQRLAEGDLTTRSGLGHEKTEIGQLARTFDSMAHALEQRVKEREQAEKSLLNRSFQQTVVGALGQFAIVSSDMPALLNQVVMLVSQTLEVEYCGVLELLPNGRFFTMRAGVGWKAGSVGKVIVPADHVSQAGFTLSAGEPVVVEDLSSETRFRGSPYLVDHGVISGVTVAVTGHGSVFGVLGVHTTRGRKFTEDEVQFLLSVATLLAMAIERGRAEAELQKLAAFAQLNPNPAMEIAPDETIPYFNDAALRLAISVGEDHPRGMLPGTAGEIVQKCLDTRLSKLRVESQISGRTLSWSFHPVLESHVVHCYIEDVTERLSLEAQLRQSQKMESVGQLAAGVAHDFNNMLTVIQGHAGMLMDKANVAPHLREPSQAIFFAAERAANLTRQLLLFSRKSVMQTTLLDLRQVVTNLSQMLQRLVGETISLRFEPPSQLPMIQADTGMLEQILMNLVVNARDAMSKGGTLLIRVDTVQVSEDYLQANPDARAGSFVCLRVSDDGCGMDAMTMTRIFEPFFTTKEVGKGTGLGLATVYAIVKQHQGWIQAASEPGKGTTFYVFFPACTGPIQAKCPDAAPPPATRRGTETILVVEDEPVLRDLAHVILEDCGYRVLDASSGLEALEVWSRNPEPIHLLLTDMIMPEGISGMNLAQRLLLDQPQLKVVFASGYSMDELDTDFVRKSGATFLQKPYTHLSLAKTVRDCLDQAIQPENNQTS